jgi:hypothetical protein
MPDSRDPEVGEADRDLVLDGFPLHIELAKLVPKRLELLRKLKDAIDAGTGNC